MADHTHIEWTDATWNPITGCSVVSAGCKHCYAMKLAGTRLQHHPSRTGLTIDTAAGPVWNGQVRFNSEWLDQPLRWRRPRRIFVCAHSDLFHEAVPDVWIAAIFGVMAAAPQHTFQVLTKRPERMLDWFKRHHQEVRSQDAQGQRWRVCEDAACEFLPHLPAAGCTQPWPLRNVWLGVSVEHQEAADRRIPLLLETPAALRWISGEPLLSRVDLGWYLRHNRWIDGICVAGADYGHGTRLDWVVAGGESGRGARPMHPDWVRSLRDQCAAAHVPFLFKQWGSFVPGDQAACGLNECYYAATRGGWVELSGIHSLGEAAEPLRSSAAHVFELGKSKAGRLLDGELHDVYPRIRA